MVIITKDKKQRWVDDFYPTPIELCRKIVNHFVVDSSPMVQQGQDQLVLDPGCGSGNFGRAIKEVYPKCIVVGVDTVDRLTDTENYKYYSRFLTLDFNSPPQVGSIRGDFRLVIGNPPFKHAEQFVKMSHILCEWQIVFLFKLAFLEGQRRAAEFFPVYLPTEVSTLNARVSWDGSGKSNDQAHAIFEWRPHYREHNLTDTRLTWLEWK
jgi:SAM-dependent methyltransferase